MRKTMNKTNKESYFEDPLAVDSTGLQELVGAGRRTATVTDAGPYKRGESFCKLLYHKQDRRRNVSENKGVQE